MGIAQTYTTSTEAVQLSYSCNNILSNFSKYYNFKLGVCDMTILDCEQLKCLHNLPLENER